MPRALIATLYLLIAGTAVPMLASATPPPSPGSPEASASLTTTPSRVSTGGSVGKDCVESTIRNRSVRIRQLKAESWDIYVQLDELAEQYAGNIKARKPLLLGIEERLIYHLGALKLNQAATLILCQGDGEPEHPVHREPSTESRPYCGRKLVSPGAAAATDAEIEARFERARARYESMLAKSKDRSAREPRSSKTLIEPEHVTPPDLPSASVLRGVEADKTVAPPPARSASRSHVQLFGQDTLERWRREAVEEFEAERRRQVQNDERLRALAWEEYQRQTAKRR